VQHGQSSRLVPKKCFCPPLLPARGGVNAQGNLNQIFQITVICPSVVEIHSVTSEIWHKIMKKVRKIEIPQRQNTGWAKKVGVLL